MKMLQAHKIKSLNIDLKQYNSSHDKRISHEEISSLLDASFQLKLNQIFDKITPSEQILVIDKIELEIGQFKKSNFKETFIETLLEAIEVYLQQLMMPQVRNTPTSIGTYPSNFTNKGNDRKRPTDHQHPPFSAIQQSANSSSSLPVMQENLHERTLTFFFFFLENGFAPWWVTHRNLRNWESLILDHISPSIAFADKLISTITFSHRLLRLTTQFSDRFLVQLLEKLDHSKKKNQQQHLRVAIEQYFSKDTNLDTIFDLIIRYEKKDSPSFPSTHFSKVQKTTYLQLLLHTKKELLVWLKSINDQLPSDDNLTKQLSTFIETTLSGFTPVLKHSDEKTNGEVQQIKFLSTDQKGEPLYTPTNNEPYPSQELIAETTSQKAEIFIDNAGLVLLSPFLNGFFKALDMLNPQNQFKGEQECYKAALLLDYACNQEVIIPELRISLNKILCGIPLEETMPNELNIHNNEKKEINTLLQSVIEHWKMLKNTSVQGLIETFLQREGKISIKENHFQLDVEKKGVDILMQALPWTIGYIKMPWMETPLIVNWN